MHLIRMTGDDNAATSIALGRTATRDFVPPQEFDDYVILHELGRGHMGCVYLAEDALLARQVAIKFIAGVEPDLEARQRFLMEARAAARIQHPNVLGVYRVGELDDRLYIVSELVRGKPLAELPRPLPWRDVLDIAIELARGLAAAHRRGVVHCDIKSANAMITEDRVAKLVDFGLARMVHEGADEGDEAAAIIGTPDYMPPEVWTGRAPNRRSDVYSFGAMLFELVAGRTPFADAPAHDLARAVTARSAPDLRALVPDVDPRFANLIARCLDRDPEQRFASGEELREALEQLHPSRAVAIKTDGNPYRGLRPFEAAHRGLFFGRGLEIGEVVERLRTDPIVIVTGDSGVGKSSLCRAGVVPAIVDGALGGARTWESVTLVPGRRPLAAFAAAVGEPALAARVLDDPEELPRELQRRAGKDRGIVLFLDQMEELVTIADPDEVAALDAGLARLCEGVPGIRIVTTVRADFLSKIASLPRLGRELARLLYFVSPLPPERLRDVVTGPAQATGVELETPELIRELVDATAQAGSGGLPLLSFALAELWERREGNRITHAALAAMGGVSGALARHGDSVLSTKTASERANIRRVLLRLVTAVGTRARRTLAELDVGPGTQAALDALVKGRLLVVHQSGATNGTTYEVAHEVLVHGWGTLREWLDDDAEDRARRERLATAAAEWDANRRRTDLTYRGPRLAEARELDTANLTAVEREFIAASLRAQARRTWIVRIAAIAVVVLVAGVYATQRHLAAERLARAVNTELTAARTALASARAANADGRALATRAFALFDTGKTTDAEELWKQVLARRRAADDSYRDAGGRVEAAFAKDPTRRDVRAILGDILLERAELADAMFQPHDRDEHVARLAAYDPDGSRRARWAAPGRLSVRAPAGAQIAIAGRPAGVGTASVELAPGGYMIEISAAGKPAIRTAALVERGAPTELVLDFPPRPLPDGYVYIPAGTFLYGTAADESTRTDFFRTSPLHRRETAAYAIAKHEVTIADWLAYADATGAAVPNLPDATTPLVLERDGRAWQIELQMQGPRYRAGWGEPIVYVGRRTQVKQDWRRFPITGITAKEAEAYAAWLARTGKVPGARLCSELEWVRAARGPDGRGFPTGDRIEKTQANLDSTHTRELMGPDEVGSHPESESPFGLHDTVGNAFEWTLGERPGEHVGRGGSFFHDRTTANLANRSVVTSDFKDPTLGLRLCATVP